MSVEYAAAENKPWDLLETPVRPAPLQRSRIGPALLVVWLGVLLAMFGMGFDSSAGRAVWGTAGYALTAALVGLLIFRPAGAPGLRNRVLAYAVPVLLVGAVLPFTSGLFIAAASAFLPAWALVTALYGVRGGLARGAGTAFTVMLGGIAGAGAAAGLLLLIVSIMFGGYEEMPLVVICFLPLLQPVVPFPRGGWLEIRKRGMELGLAVLVVLAGSGWFLPLFGESSSTEAVLSSLMGGLAYVAGTVTAGAAVKRAGWAREKTAEYAPYPAKATPTAKTG